MKNFIVGLLFAFLFVPKSYAITVPLAFGVTGNSAASSNSVVYRDGSGNFDIAGATAGAAGFTSSGPVSFSSSVVLGVSVSTQAAGTAGALVTAICGTVGTSALGGGCNCGTVVAATSVVSVPNCVTAGCIPNGWSCQVAGGTGGQCSAYAICSRAQ